jgi:hypothetical protein
VQAERRRRKESFSDFLPIFGEVFRMAAGAMNTSAPQLPDCNHTVGFSKHAERYVRVPFTDRLIDVLAPKVEPALN